MIRKYWKLWLRAWRTHPTVVIYRDAITSRRKNQKGLNHE